MGADDVNDLFESNYWHVDSASEIRELLEQFKNRRLVYPGGGNRNIGYIFRGEIDFPVPLQPSLERWFRMGNGDKCPATELLSFEKSLIEQFMRIAPAIRDLSKEHQDVRPELPHDQNAFEWLQLKQHYRTRTRFLDFTNNICIALYFALEQFCNERNAALRRGGLSIYCFPCVDEDARKSGDDNKTPFDIREGPIDINLAIGGQMGLDRMEPHNAALEQRYCRTKQKQSFGWDRAYQPNPRLSFQEGMLAYPYEIDGVIIEQNKSSWFVQCLRLNPSDPFHLGSAKGELPPLMIRIPEKSVSHALEYVQDVCGLTPAKVYLDYGKIGDRLRTK